MFNNKLVVAIKTAGKVLRESGDKVYLPFGSEYSIFLKNLNSVRALVRVSLDGKSVTDGEDLVIYGNTELNLERFLKKGNMESGNRFKFIERTSKVERHRGIEAEDGLLRVEFQFEKVTPKQIVVETIHKHYYDHYRYYPYYPWGNPWGGPYYGSCSFASSNVGGVGSAQNYTANVVNCSASLGNTTRSMPPGGTPPPAGTSSTLTSSGVTQQAFLNQVANDAGITVAGSVSDQKFQNAAWFAVDDEKFVIVLKLLGETGGHIIEHPVLVRQKQTCTSCGTRNRGRNQYCRECGTALELVGQSPKRRIGVRG